jgi:hypothetical protein
MTKADILEGNETLKNFYFLFYPSAQNVVLLSEMYTNWFFMTPSIATKFQYINSL